MVARMIKWLAGPASPSRKFQVYLKIHALEGIFRISTEKSGNQGELKGIMVDVKWKGHKGSFFRRRSLKRDRTAVRTPTENGIVSWEEESGCECVLVESKNNSYQPWDVHFVVRRAVPHGDKLRLLVCGTAVINIVDFIPSEDGSSATTRITVSGSCGADKATLVVSLNFMEIRAIQEVGIDFRGPIVGYSSLLSQHNDGGAWHKALKNAKRPAEGKISQELFMFDRSKFSSSGEGSSQGSTGLFDSSSAEDIGEEVLDDDVGNSSYRKSFSYGTLAGINLVLEGALPSFRKGQIFNEEHVASIHSRVEPDAIPSVLNGLLISDSKRACSQSWRWNLLAWKKRKLGFRSPRARGEPLLNKSYGDDGGDDIDHDRRQSCSSVAEQHLALCLHNGHSTPPNLLGCLYFEEDGFTVGSWEKKEFVSRDGRLKLSASVFFASIDQRSEKASGESACTALVAVIAHWLHKNPNRMPIQTEFDILIREGSAEWRKLCETKAYGEQFPDGHFDLDSVLHAKVRPLKVISSRSYVGFFEPDGLEDCCEFLQGAMLFDNIWDAIVEESQFMKHGASFEPAVYVVSWNDHFFILKVDHDAFYVIDTLGERLYEGCNQAYIIRFDEGARLCHISQDDIVVGEEAAECLSSATPSDFRSLSSSFRRLSSKPEARGLDKNGDKCMHAHEACKRFLKGFFAAVPLRELHMDVKKGLLTKFPIHQRLQIEFHFVTLDLTAQERKA